MVAAAGLADDASAEELVPGDHDGILAIADHLRAHSVVLDEGSGSLSRVEVTGWRGSASTGFQAALEVEPGRWASAARAFDEAATAMRGYAASLGPAREVAERARRLYRAHSGPLSTARTRAEQRQDRQRYLGGTLLGPPPAEPPSAGLFEDGASQRDQARALLAHARSSVLAAGNIAADTLTTAMAQAPEARRFYEETIRPAGAEESTHTALDLAGMLPAVGMVADLVNAGWYAGEGRTLDAGLSLVSAVPGIGDGIGAGVITARVASRLASRYVDAAEIILKDPADSFVAPGVPIGAESSLVPGGGLLAHDGRGLPPSHPMSHVGKTDAELAARFNPTPRADGSLPHIPPRNSTFLDRAAAERYVAETLENHAAEVQRFLHGSTDELRLRSTSDEVIGRTAFRGPPVYVRDSYTAFVLLRRDATMPSGYRIHTSYPEP